MLLVKVNRRKVYVDFEEDTAPNKGGYFCKVYGDSEKFDYIDCFTIRKENVRGSEPLKRAMLYANEYIQTHYTRRR